ncbi:MAG: divalent metal cation transporter [Pseudomonadota bacterium]
MSDPTQKPALHYSLGQEQGADQSLARLKAAYRAPVWQRPWRLLNLGGPGFANAALTLGAGSLTAAMLSGVNYGYRLLWVPVLAMGLELFLLAGMARLACRPGLKLIEIQNRRHGQWIGTVLTALVGCFAVAVVFNFGQVVLGLHLIQEGGKAASIEIPRHAAALGYFVLTASLVLAFERGGRYVHLIDGAMKGAIAIMLLAFGGSLLAVGIDWRAAVDGLLSPWLPEGRSGIDLLLGTVGAAAGVMCWVFFVAAGREREWQPEHEPLARFDLLAGMFTPFVLINVLVICLFAGTLYGTGVQAEGAPALVEALVPALGDGIAKLIFYLGFVCVPLTTTVAMSIAGATAVFDALGWSREERPWAWRLLALAPQLAIVAVWFPSVRPLWLVIGLAALMTLTNNFVAWSLYLLLNDDEVLPRDRQPGAFWNAGIALHITFLNCAAALFVLNRFGVWQ